MSIGLPRLNNFVKILRIEHSFTRRTFRTHIRLVHSWVMIMAPIRACHYFVTNNWIYGGIVLYLVINNIPWYLILPYILFFNITDILWSTYHFCHYNTLTGMVACSLVHRNLPNLQYRTANDWKLLGNSTKLLAYLTLKWRCLFKPPLICCFPTFCSISGNKISDKGACAVGSALQVNQSLQELEWVQPFMSYFIRGDTEAVRVIPRPML